MKHTLRFMKGFIVFLIVFLISVIVWSIIEIFRITEFKEICMFVVSIVFGLAGIYFLGRLYETIFERKK